jgi:hypothetical protein
LAYLLRLWQVEDRGTFAWRALLERAHTGERRGFPDLASLCTFLVAETEENELAAECDFNAQDAAPESAEPDFFDRSA